MNTVAYRPNGTKYFAPRSFNNLLNGFFEDAVNFERKSTFVPQVDIAESETAFELAVYLPGINKEDISIDLEDNNLSISGERKAEEKEGFKYHKQESASGKFSRKFLLPENVNAENIEASFKNGVLHLSLPKEAPEEKKLKINIK